eukprot:288326-Chlamydomonas_euryale.AAC.1
MAAAASCTALPPPPPRRAVAAATASPCSVASAHNVVRRPRTLSWWTCVVVGVARCSGVGCR